MHGGSLSVKRICLFLLTLFSISGFAAVINTKKANQVFEPNTILNSYKSKYSLKDKKLANNIAAMFETTQKGYPNKQIIIKLVKRIKKNKDFHMFLPWVKNTLKVTKSESVYKTNKLCLKLLNKKTKSSISNSLLENNRELCLNKFLNIISKKNISISSLKVFVKTLTKDTSLILSKNNIDDLSYLLSRLRVNTHQHKLLSKELTNYFLTRNITPPKKLLKYMHIDHDLTKFIQIAGINAYSTKSIFHNEFKKLIKLTYNLADNNKSEDQINTELSKALNYYKSTYEHLPLRKSSKILLGLGKSLMRRSYYKPAQNLYTTLIETSSPNLSESYFELMWTYLTQEDYEGAYNKVIKKHALLSKFKRFKNSKLSFWIGYTLMEEDNDSFKGIFETLIKDNPLSYYSIIASKQLQQHYKIPFHNIFLNIVNSDQFKQSSRNSLSLTREGYRSLKRLKLWGKIDFKPLIKIELLNFTASNKNLIIDSKTNLNEKEIEKAFNYLTAKSLNSAENYLESFKVVYKAINKSAITINTDVLEILYPKPYWKKIKSSVKDFDPVIALSLIRQESAFNKNARSRVGARGLMQIMPKTGRMLWRRLKTRQLSNANLNIKIGSKYLSNLMKRYDHNLVYTLSAYNAGEGRVKKWRKEYMLSDSILHNIENIPFSETRKYVKLIFRNIFFYKLNNDVSHKVELAESKKMNRMFSIYLGFNK
jgi:soluble lytic murein transglycosylase